jgi:hypothetical protein
LRQNRREQRVSLQGFGSWLHRLEVAAESLANLPFNRGFIHGLALETLTRLPLFSMYEGCTVWGNMADDDKDTLAESWLRSLKNRPTVAAVLLMVIVIAGIASFTDSIDKIIKFFAENSNKFGDTKKTDQDVRLEQQILGTWICNAKLPTPTGFIVKDIRNTFLSDGTYNTIGKYVYLDNEFPIMVSGTWHVKDHVLHWKVESSNVPLVMRDGFSSITKIISVTDDKWTYLDPNDRQVKVDFRVK